MGKLNDIAAKLLKAGEVQVVIGYGEGTKGRIRPLFARDENEANELIFDERCTQNLAMYVYKKETSKLGKPAVIANIHTLRGIIRLAAENQLKEGDVIALYATKDEVKELKTLDEIEAYLSTITPQLSDEDKEMIAKLEAMTVAERWAFWQKELENCIKCYACRQACPLCYCTQCAVETNQPQWIPVESTKIGNLEWHITRAMHLAGRCVECGQCGEACPVNIPIHLLPMKLAKDMRELYGSVTGMSRQEGYAMATYKPDDKENFIG